MRKGAVSTGAGRTGRGFRHAGGLIASRLRKAGERQGFAQTRLLTEWEDVVGAEIAAKAQPLKVTYARGGFGATLILLCRGAVAPEVEMLAPTIRERVNACYGFNAISRIRLTQTAPVGFAEAQSTYSTAPTARDLSPAETREMTDALAGVESTELRAALEALGRNIKTYSATKGDRP